MPVPLAIAAPAAVAGLAYLNAKTQFPNDYRLLSAVFTAVIKGRLRERRGKLNLFYLLEEQAAAYPNTTLVIFEGRKWTYKETYDLVLKYGSWLKKRFAIKRGEIVAMDFENSEQFLFVWFGLWSIGAKPAFINYNLRGKPLAHCVRVSTARVVLVDERVKSALDTIEGEDAAYFAEKEVVVFSKELEAEALGTKGVREPDEVMEEKELKDLAMLIYTSGTTGLPKPAHVSWSKCLIGGGLIPKWTSFKKNDIFYTCMPLYHSSASILGFLTTLTAGCTFSLGRKFSNSTFWPDVHASNATIIHYVGETCRYLLSAPPYLSPSGENLDRKNAVRMAFGNGLRPDIWNAFKERFDINIIAEFYSATEGSSGAWNYSRNDFARGAIGRIGSIGKTLFGGGAAVVEIDTDSDLPSRSPNTGLCIPVPPSEPGELLYRLDAANVEAAFQGYFNNPKASASKILRSVLKKDDAWFRTGDLVRVDTEGRTFFHDRIGDTYRWKSENVSTNEVAEALGAYEDVVEANVYGVQLPHHDGRAGCVALVLKGAGAIGSGAGGSKERERIMGDFGSFVLGALPRYAVPIFVRFEEGGEGSESANRTGTNKQQKHVLREQGVDLDKVGRDEVWWLKGGRYVRFGRGEWDELRGGRLRL